MFLRKIFSPASVASYSLFPGDEVVALLGWAVTVLNGRENCTSMALEKPQKALPFRCQVSNPTRSPTVDLE